MRQSWSVYRQLLVLSLPLIVAIKWLQDSFQFIDRVGEVLAPIMGVLNLPGEAGVVWATAIFINLYAAILVLIQLWGKLQLSVGQVSVLSLLMLVAHNLVVESIIVHKAGVRFAYAVALRLLVGFLFALLISLLYQWGGWLQQPATLQIDVMPAIPADWPGWMRYQLDVWIKIALVVIVLVYFSLALRVTHFERIVTGLLQPVLRLLGIGKKATTITIIGMTVGIAYGGAMLIEEARGKQIPRSDLLCSITLLCLNHAIFEDTLLMLLIGADVSAVFWGRLVFSILFMLAFVGLLRCPGSDAVVGCLCHNRRQPRVAGR